MNYLRTDHWAAVLKATFPHSSAAGKAAILAIASDPSASASSSAPAPSEFDITDFCARVIELTSDSLGCVLGHLTAPGQLILAREHGNHFVPVLRYTSPTQDKVWAPW